MVNSYCILGFLFHIFSRFLYLRNKLGVCSEWVGNVISFMPWIFSPVSSLESWHQRIFLVHTPVTLLRSLSGKYPWERYEPPYPPSYGLNSTTTVLLGEWLWHWITYEVWYAIKQRNRTKLNFSVLLFCCLKAWVPSTWSHSSIISFYVQTIMSITDSPRDECTLVELLVSPSFCDLVSIKVNSLVDL